MRDEINMALSAVRSAAHALGPKDLLIAAVGSAAGAWGGAYAAQRIAERGALRKVLTDEIRATNAAHSLVVHACNDLVQLRRQLVDPAVQFYDEQKAAFLAHELTKVSIVLQEFNAPLPDADIIRDRVLALQAPPRASILSMSFASAIHGLQRSFLRRDEWIASFREQERHAKTDDPLLLMRYLALPTDKGTDAFYEHVLHNIQQQVRGALYFSYQLALELSAHGEGKADQFKLHFGKPTPPVHRADFSKAEAFIPKEDEGYQSYGKDNFTGT
jgi:hypothetical protein